ncbi:MAG: polysaccharide-degrading enzyme [Proteobacteria bacterium]|nr:polysaccharide-degrading enzyme [Pseudomonadota bacterium]MCP4922079.1 polysaccharide-degrading enzyme [Pseudomonadota bacterium]
MIWLLACVEFHGPDNSGAPVFDTADTGLEVPAGVIPTWDEFEFEHVFEVGEGQEFATPSEVPWEALKPSTLVRIHTGTYADKWVVDVAGTEDAPIVVLGVDRPVITGQDAVTREALDFWSETRGVVKVGGSSVPGEGAAWVWIQGLDIRSGHDAYGFTDDRGEAQVYDDNAAAVFVESGERIHVVDCVLSDSGNGLFVASGASDVLVQANTIQGNGNVGSAYEHNSYTEAERITFEFNDYGPLRDGADGNNLKDRSAGTVIRYNRITDGNRQLDLVDTDHFVGHEDYGDVWVYGNLLIEGDDGNSQIVHYGGDSGNAEQYRNGSLYFFHNTVRTTRPGNTTLVRLSDENQWISATDNIVWTDGPLGILDGEGTARLAGNWLTEGWVDGFGEPGQVRDEGNTGGAAPPLDAELRPTEAMPDSEASISGHPVQWEFGLVERMESTDIGARQSL